MPIVEYKCGDCCSVSEKVHLSVSVPAQQFIVCESCDGGLAEKIMSTPARITMADMEKVNRKRQRIKEPMWRDVKTGKLTPVNP